MLNWGTASQTSRRRCVGKTRAEHEDREGPAVDIDLGEDEATLAWERVMMRRMEWQKDPDNVDGENFYTTILGGRWTRRHKGVAFDNYICKARAGLPSAFCQVYTLGRLHSFTIKAHTEKGAGMMAAETARRLEYFYSIYYESPEETHVFSQQEIDDCPESFEYVSWMCDDVDQNSVTWTRAMAVKKLAPTNCTV